MDLKSLVSRMLRYSRSCVVTFDEREGRLADLLKDNSFTLHPEPIEAVVCVFDIEGFTAFCGLDDAPRRVAPLLKATFNLVDFALSSEDEEDREYLSFQGVAPMHIKFLGDGGLIIWKCPTASGLATEFYLKLLHALYQARTLYRHESSELAGEIGIPKIPESLRVGVAMGQVLQMKCGPSGLEEYIGVPINLASRLECYCRDLGFLASGRDLKTRDLDDSGFIRVKTKSEPRGFFTTEFVVADELDFSRLKEKALKKLFNLDDYDADPESLAAL